MNILLACNAGMSTSMLVEKMKEAAAAAGKDHTIRAVPIEAVQDNLDGVDVILLGPQVRTRLKKVQAVAGSVPVDVIAPADYGRMNGAGVLKTAESHQK